MPCVVGHVTFACSARRPVYCIRRWDAEPSVCSSQAQRAECQGGEGFVWAGLSILLTPVHSAMGQSEIEPDGGNVVGYRR